MLRLEERTLALAGRCGAAGQSGGADFRNAVVIICLSTAGIVGSLTAGTGGGSAMLYVKAMMDLPTVMLFASLLGPRVGLLCLPEMLIMALLYALSRALLPLLTPEMTGNLQACGGVILLGSALNLTGASDCPVIDFTPALLLAMPLTHLAG